jgi:hypothetical protein
MSNQLVITSGAKVRSLNGVITGTTGVLDSLPINAANGIPQLDSSGKILVSQLPNSVMEYKGTWNAATNTPTLADGTGNQGDVYLCNVAGTVNFGSGPISFVVGDQVIYSGTIWQRASGATGTVTSVAVTESGDALSITGSPITTSGTINIGFAGTSAQYVAGDGSLITFPTVVTQAQNLVTEVYNETGATLTKGTVVYINGGHGNLPTVTKAIATADSTSAQTYGVVRTDITNNNNGYVTVIGNLDNLDTQAYAAGTQLYLSSTTAGAWTSVKQYAPAHLVYVGIVVRSHPTQGVVEIRIQNGFELDELHNVSAQTPSNNQGIFYNSSTSLWENKSIATALGFTPISLSSLSATTPLSYNSGTGAFSIQQSSGSQSGYLSSTDWTTFNNKQSALTNPVTGTGTSGQVSYFNGTSTITGSNNFKFDGTNLSIGNPSSALAQLHIYNSAAAASFLLQTNSTTDYSEIAVRNDSSTATSYFRQYSTAASGSDFGISRAGLALFFSNYATNFAIGTRNGGNLIFGTADTERARIDTSGNFGIGLSTINNNYKLIVRRSTNVNIGFGLQGGEASIESFNDALTSSMPLRIYGSTLSFYGAATFSSSVTVNGDSSIFNGGTANNFNTYALGIANTKYLVFASTAAAQAGGRNWSGGIGADSSENVFLGSYNNLSFGAGTLATRMTILGSNGNVGIGITPQWNLSSFKSLEISDTGLIYGGSGQLAFVNNAYYDSGWKYKTTNYAVLNATDSGQFTWSTAASGSVGGAVSWNERMRLTNAGNLGIGTSSPSQKLDVQGGIYASYLRQNGRPGDGGTTMYTGSTGGALGISNGTNTVTINRYTYSGFAGFLSSNSEFYGMCNDHEYGGPGAQLSIIAGTTTGTIAFFVGNPTSQPNGAYQAPKVSYINSSGTYVTVSDINKKKDLESSTIGLKEVLQLNPTLFRMKFEDETFPKQLGFIAQEVKEVIPEAYYEDGTFIGLTDRPIIAALVKAIQEQQAQIEELKAKIK